jgi:Transposase zinc-binding domain
MYSTLSYRRPARWPDRARVARDVRDAREEQEARFVYDRRRPEKTTLHRVVRENLETLYAAVDAGEGNALPAFVRKELEGYLACGLLACGFAHLKCESCGERRLVSFACKGRGFCPSCMGRRMCQTAANLIERTLPKTPLRQWVLTVPFELRHRLAYDGKLLGAVNRIFTDTVLRFYKGKLGERGKSGALSVVQRSSSDLRLNPHVHAVVLDGVFVERDNALAFVAQGHLRTQEVCDVLHTTVVRAIFLLAFRTLRALRFRATATCINFANNS